MSNNNSNTGGVILIVVLLVLGAYLYSLKTKNKPTIPAIPNTIVLETAEQTGVKYSPTMASIRKDLQKLQDDGTLIMTVKPGKLMNPILGQTSIIINADGKVEATIVMDVEDAILAGDSAEPLLGHEFKHVWDALFLYDKTSPYVSATKFIETANKQKNNNTLYRNREVESSAIGIEDIIRKELIRSGNATFAKLPDSRQSADNRYAEKVKFNPQLK